MKKELTVLSCFCTTLLLSTALPCIAKNSNGNKPVGNPFNELRALIGENRSLIDANQGTIATLKTETDAINARIDGVQTELAEVAGQVATNSADISSAFARIAAAEGDIDTLRNDLSGLAEQHQTDIADLEAHLNDIQSQIDALVAQSVALATELNDQVDELRGRINDNAVGIDALVLDISLLNAQVGSINSSILALSNQQTNLTDQVADHSAQLTNLAAALDVLKLRVDGYYHNEPCVEVIDKGDTITGELVNDGECTSDSRHYGGTHGARYYTFTIASPATVTISMDGYYCNGPGTLSDPYLFLHLGGRDGELITRNDDGGCVLNSRISRTLQPGTYTIEATSYRSIYYGTFRLSVQ